MTASAVPVLKCLTSKIVRTAGPTVRRQFSASPLVFAHQHVKYEVKDGVGILRFDSPNSKVNVLSQATQSELVETFDEFLNDKRVFSGVLISGKPGCFIAGADIKMLERCKSAQEAEAVAKDGQLMHSFIEKSPKPIVAAIMGQCLGGGLETALACAYRIGVKDQSTFALPEVMLGLLPGAGGCVRLPRTVPWTDALDMILTGRSIAASKAKKIGLIDEIVDPIGPGVDSPEARTLLYLENAAIEAAKVLAAREQKGLSRTAPRKEGALAYIAKYVLVSPLRDYFLSAFYNRLVLPKLMAQTQGKYPAPLRIIDVFRASTEYGPEEGLEAEAQAFGELAMTKESKALIGLYHGQTATKKNPIDSDAQPAPSAIM